MDYNRIKTEADQQNISIRDLCNRINITEQGLHQMIRNRSMKVEVLERISYVLGVPVTFWFENAEYPAEYQNAGIDAAKTAEPDTPAKAIFRKIDSLTRGLNEVLKEMIPK